MNGLELLMRSMGIDPNEMLGQMRGTLETFQREHAAMKQEISAIAHMVAEIHARLAPDDPPVFSQARVPQALLGEHMALAEQSQ